MTSNGAVRAGTRRDRFASGASVKLPLSDGDWVLVHAALSYGQQRRLATAGLTGVPDALASQGVGQGVQVDWAAFDIERLVTWVMDWSLVDADGDHVTVSRAAIEALDPETAQEIHAVLNRHQEAVEAKKGPPDGPPKPEATSSSVSASAGPGTS